MSSFCKMVQNKYNLVATAGGIGVCLWLYICEVTYKVLVEFRQTRFSVIVKYENGFNHADRIRIAYNGNLIIVQNFLFRFVFSSEI